MAFTLPLIGDLADLGLNDFQIGPGNARKIRGYVRTNLGAGDALIDTTNQVTLLGDTPITILSNGTWSVDLLDTSSTDLNVEANTLQYELVVEYTSTGSPAKRVYRSGWFALTEADLELVDDVPMAVFSSLDLDLPSVTPSWRSAFMAEAESLLAQQEAISGLTGEDAAVALLIDTPASDTATALSATYVATAAAPTGVAANDAAALVAAHAALPAGGGAIRLRRGVYNLGTTTVTFTKPVTLIGEGGALVGDGSLSPIRAITTIVSTSATADCLVFSGKGNTILDLAVVNEAATTPTAGTGIKATGMSQSHMARVTVLGFYNCIETRGTHWTIDSCHIYDPVNFGLWGNNDALGASYTDHGDYGVINCIINTMYKTWAGVAGFKWTGGGGIRWVGNKINGGTQPGSPSNARFQYGAHIEATTSTGTTGELTMSGGGIANCTVACLRVTQSDSGAFIHTKISGMQINSSSASCVGVHVGASSAALINQVRDVTIVDNTFNLLPGSHIIADYVTGLTIGLNHHSVAPTDGASPVIRLGDGTVTSAPLSVNMAPQAWPRTACLLIEDWRSNGNNNDLDGRLVHDYESQWHGTVHNTDVTMFRITPGTHGAVMAELFIEGYNWSSGRNFILRQVRSILRTGTGSAVQTTMGTDLTAGTAAADVTVTYDAAAVSGEIAVKVKTTNATYPSADAKVRLALYGNVQKVRKGA